MYINVDRMYFFTMNKIAEMKKYRTIDHSLFLINFPDTLDIKRYSLQVKRSGGMGDNNPAGKF